MDFESLQKEAHAIARGKGLYDTGRSFSSFIEAIHETLSEAGKAYRKHGFDSGIVAPEASVTPNDIVAGGQLIPDGTPVYLGHVLEAKPFGVPCELAGVVIQVADMAEYYEIQDLEAHANNSRGAYQAFEGQAFEGLKDKTRSFDQVIAIAHWGTAQIFRIQMVSPNYYPAPPSWHRRLGWLLQFVQETAVHHGIDLDAAVAARMEYLRR